MSHIKDYDEKKVEKRREKNLTKAALLKKISIRIEDSMYAM